ncbi:LicD family protein [Enterococcus lactis]|mgnify:CR=1 FL=1|uniref:LicD family protein n=3 Tax=Enterococcus TaxID=1350 RepID=UPI0019F6FAA5|nr:LicD family protein [Enterococcus lactis]EGP5038365.1 LicD family protein [Enterococcus faecium]EGP5737672.1 LicD family protein [Enterococcus faecium]EME8252322.1 LicD family protein [Enterococcus faecium]EMF0488619.1 LicD family protein [Enterococcus faecium]MDT2791098.1 LicD family protein [Enterococcus lactis]
MSEYLSTKEIHDGLLDLLKFFDQFCQKHNLTYFLAGGTLLGAIRHKGFIPWDDDADIIMPREDYNKLISLSLELPAYLELKALEIDNKWEYAFAKINDTRTYIDDDYRIAQHGLFLDIFPIDSAPENKYTQKYLVKRMKMLDVFRGAQSKKKFKPEEKFIFIKKIISKYAKSKGANYFAVKMNQLANSTNKRYANSKFKGVCVSTIYGVREFLPTSTFSEVTYVEFEDTTLSIPKDYKTYLESLYGDYMQLPPLEKQKGDHYKIKRY